MEDFNSSLNWMFWSMIIGGIAQLVILIVLIVKFLTLTEDVSVLRKSLASTSNQDFKKDFYKWIVCGDKERAKEVLINEIGNSFEFTQLIRGGNDKYVSDLKDKIRNRYETELKAANIDLDLNNLG